MKDRDEQVNARLGHHGGRFALFRQERTVRLDSKTEHGRERKLYPVLKKRKEHQNERKNARPNEEINAFSLLFGCHRQS